MITAIRTRDAHRFVRKVWPWLLIVLVALALVWRTQAVSGEAKDSAAEAKHTAAKVHVLTLENEQLVRDLQAALVISCEQNGNARARVEREALREEIQEAKHPDPEAFKALVEAGVSEKAIFESERKAIVKFEDRLARVKIADCQTQYQIGPGSK